MKNRPFPIREASSRSLKKCQNCFHFHRSGMQRCMGDGTIGYCFKWTWKHDEWVRVKTGETCPKFFPAIPIVSLFWTIGEAQLLDKYGHTGYKPCSYALQRMTPDINETNGENLNNKRESVYNFIEIREKITHFARVTTAIQETTNRNEVVQSLSEKPNLDNGEVNAESHLEWVEAALQGIEEALLIANKRTGLFYSVRLIGIKGSPVDTTSSVVKCATTLSVLCGILPRAECPSAIFNNGIWTLTEFEAAK